MASLYLIRSSDDEFKQQVGLMSPREILSLMNEIASDMEREQSTFESLSSQLDDITDQSSASFTSVSTELIKSQNWLALLMSRNMMCLDILNSLEGKSEEKVGAYITKPPPKKQEAVRKSYIKNYAGRHSDSSVDSKHENYSSNHKVVRVTKIVSTRRTIDNNNSEIDPELKRVFASQLKKIANAKKSGSSTNSVCNGMDGAADHRIVAADNVTTAADDVIATADVPPLQSSSVKSTDINIPITSSRPSKHAGEVNQPIGVEVTSADSYGVSSPARTSTDVTTMDAVGEDTSRSHSDMSTSSSATDLAYDFSSSDFEPEKVKERIFVKSWNPEKLIAELYSIQLAKEPNAVSFDDVINMEGYLEQLPVGKKKTTLLKTWKRVYCRARDGQLYFFRSKGNESEPLSNFLLVGGAIEEMSGRMIGIDDKRGHYLMIRCPSDKEYRDWMRSLYSQTRCSSTVNYIRPTLSSPPHSSHIVIIDLGSCSVRAGVLGTTPSYPQLFFPCVTTTDGRGGYVFGGECYSPERRARGLHYPVSSCDRVNSYKVNVTALEGLFKMTFSHLAVQPSEYTVLLSTPHNFSLRLRQEVYSILFNGLKVKATHIINQSLLTPYLYSATSGIVVDIGERIEIIPITDGYLVEEGVVRRAFGGKSVTETLNSCLMEYRLFTPVENLITRLIKEKTCFVSQDYDDDLLECSADVTNFQAVVNLRDFSLPDGFHLREVVVDAARFRAPEGLIKTELLGVDSSTLPQLIREAIAACPMDVRREMWRSVYLSGGTTLTEGFAERLHTELSSLAPPGIEVQIHASAHRYHSAYIGACMLAKLPNFRKTCVSCEDWLRRNNTTPTTT